jgi:hypothetical protein
MIFFACLEVNKCVFIWYMIYIRVPLICFKGYLPTNFEQLTRMLSFSCRFIVWYINMVFILRNQRVQKSLLEISQVNLSTDFGGVLMMHSGELKMRFLQSVPIHIVWYILNFFHCLDVNKCVFICNIIYIRVPLICFKIYQHQNYYQLTPL